MRASEYQRSVATKSIGYFTKIMELFQSNPCARSRSQLTSGCHFALDLADS